jgi:hypothetical protein
MIGAQKVGYFGREVRAHSNNVITILTTHDTHPLLPVKNVLRTIYHFKITPGGPWTARILWTLSSIPSANGAYHLRSAGAGTIDCRKLWLTGVDQRTDVGIQTVATSAEIPSAWPPSSPSSWSSRVNSPIYGPLVGPIYEWDGCSTVLGLGSGFREHGYGTVDFCHSCSDVHDNFWRTSVLTERYEMCQSVAVADILQIECSACGT